MNRSIDLKMAVIGTAVCMIGISGMPAQSNASVGVGVDVNTPNVRVQVGNPAPPPRVVVMEPERVIVREHDRHHDNGKHKGHYKRHKKQRKHREHEEHGDHDRHDR
jgi:hypothetical protein